MVRRVESHPTDLAHVRTLSRVCPLVLGQAKVRIKGTWAVGAFVWFLSSVSPKMNGQTGFRGEPTSALKEEDD